MAPDRPLSSSARIASGALVLEVRSGGQTGVDRAALDVALALGIPCTGWVPRGRLAEDGVLPARYDGLRETVSADYDDRTEANVRDADATLILGFGPPTGGTLLTLEAAARLRKPVCLVDLDGPSTTRAAAEIRAWLAGLPGPVRLNVAGPRASLAPQAYDRAVVVLRAVLE